MSPITQIRQICHEHEGYHGAITCDCMARISEIVRVYFPEGIENVFFEDAEGNRIDPE